MNLEQQIQQIYNSVSTFLGQRLLDEQNVPLCNCLGTIFTADEGGVSCWTQLFGIMSFEYDRRGRCAFLRLYNIDTFEIKFQCEMYYGFDEYLIGVTNYRVISPQLHAFDYFGGTVMIGFRSITEAQRMLNSIKANAPKQKDLISLQSKPKESKDGIMEWISKKIFQSRETVHQPKQEVAFNRQTTNQSPAMSVDKRTVRAVGQDGRGSNRNDLSIERKVVQQERPRGTTVRIATERSSARPFESSFDQNKKTVQFKEVIRPVTPTVLPKLPNSIIQPPPSEPRSRVGRVLVQQKHELKCPAPLIPAQLPKSSELKSSSSSLKKSTPKSIDINFFCKDVSPKRQAEQDPQRYSPERKRMFQEVMAGAFKLKKMEVQPKSPPKEPEITQDNYLLQALQQRAKRLRSYDQEQDPDPDVVTIV